MRQDTVTDLGYRYIMIWRKCCFFLVEKTSLQYSDVNLPLTCSRVFLFTIAHLSTLPTIIYQIMSFGQYFEKSPIVIRTILSQYRGI